MKKNILLLLIATVLCHSLSGQDVETHPMEQIYMDSHYLLPVDLSEWWNRSDDELRYLHGPLCLLYGRSQGNGVKLYTDTRHIVYGAVVSFIPFYEGLADVMAISLLKPIGYDTARNGDGALRTNTATYSLSQPTYTLPPAMGVTRHLGWEADTLFENVPVYEAYFDDPAIIVDSFYLVLHIPQDIPAYQNEGIMSVILDTAVTFQRAEFCFRSWNLSPGNFYISDSVVLTSYTDGNYSLYSHEQPPFYYQHILYPILTPDPNRDTIANPYHYPSDDTTGAAIYSPQLLERYTQLIPSLVEVGGTATVLSSFHLQAVELYDAAGRLVQSRPARGTAAAVDCTALPRGSYLVRLVTTAGTTTKKLTIH